MTHKYVSSKVVISKIATQFKFSDTSWQSLVIEYIGEAIKLIGYHTGFIKIQDFKVPVSNYTAKIPCEFEVVDYITHCGCPLFLAYGPSVNSQSTPVIATHGEVMNYNDEVARIEKLKELIQEEELNIFNPDLSKIQAMREALNGIYNKLVSIGSTVSLGSHYEEFTGKFYWMEKGVIKTSFESGEIELTGTSLPLDEEGFPMILDSGNYLKAIEWYVLFQMLLGEYSHNKLDWREAESRWEDFRYRASNEAKMLSRAELDRFTARWNSIKRDRSFTYQV